MYHTDDTIAAIASAPGGAARGIVRLSGPQVATILNACFCPDEGHSVSAVRRATALSGTIELAAQHPGRLAVDVYLWPEKRSYTRQCAAEVHTIGSPPILSALLRTLCNAGARLAEPGEFTLRAFLAGRIDLTQAEAVLGVIDAQGEASLRFALAQMAGGLTQPLSALRDRLLDLLAELEAGLDFAEEDIVFLSPQQVERGLDDAAQVVAGLIAQLAGRTRLDEMARAVLVGCPNVGKSSLFNALSASAGALVSDRPGTTRDYLMATLELGKVRCQLIDTAGVEPCGSDQHAPDVARAAQRLAGSERDHSDIRLLCLDSTRPLNDWERRELAAEQPGSRLVALTKCDAPCHVSLPCDVIRTSAVSGLGLDVVRQALQRAIARLALGESTAGLTAERCADSLRAASDALARASTVNQIGAGDELIASEIRVALVELGKVVGADYTEDVLDRIFSRFCIGK